MGLCDLANGQRSIFVVPLRQGNDSQAGIFRLCRDPHVSIPQKVINSIPAGLEHDLESRWFQG